MTPGDAQIKIDEAGRIARIAGVQFDGINKLYIAALMNDNTALAQTYADQLHQLLDVQLDAFAVQQSTKLRCSNRHK